jgi:propanediol utilization protein
METSLEFSPRNVDPSGSLFGTAAVHTQSPHCDVFAHDHLIIAQRHIFANSTSMQLCQLQKALLWVYVA